MRIIAFLWWVLIFGFVFEYYMRFMEWFLGFLLMNCLSFLIECLKHLSKKCNFGCGNWMFGCCEQVLEVFTLFLLFGFGLKVLKFNWYFKDFNRFLPDFRRKSGLLQNGIWSKSDLEVKCCSNSQSGKCRLVRNLQNLCPSVLGNWAKNDSSKCSPAADVSVKAVLKGDSDDDHNDGKCEDCVEDDEFDVLALRKLVKKERRRAKSLYLELEKERIASATAAEEAMAMILRLQNEKSSVEMEAKQYKRLTEEKQLHDQGVIQSLQWLVLEHESVRTLVEKKLILCQQKMGIQGNEDDEEETFEESVCSFECLRENALDPRLFSSLDMDLSME